MLSKLSLGRNTTLVVIGLTATGLFAGCKPITIQVVAPTTAPAGATDNGQQAAPRMMQPNTQTKPNETMSNNTPQGDATPVAGDVFLFSGATVKYSPRGSLVTGTVTNTSATIKSGAVKAIIYDASGRVLGTALGAVSKLGPGQSAQFSLGTIDNVSSWSSVKVGTVTTY